MNMAVNIEASAYGEEISTKEKVFEVALDLFAQKGYDAVSMREIADAVGIRKASLYSHFSSKDDLLEQIFLYPMAEMESLGPRGADNEKLIVSMGVEGFMVMSDKVFSQWIATPRMEKIWRIVCIELYHDDRIRRFYSKFTGDTLAFWQSNFEIMSKHKLIKHLEPEVLAREYLSYYMYLFMDYFIVNYGNTGSFLQAEGKRLEEHTAFLVRSIIA
jgi:AcrR family transcriptional regulator